MFSVVIDRLADFVIEEFGLEGRITVKKEKLIIYSNILPSGLCELEGQGSFLPRIIVLFALVPSIVMSAVLLHRYYLQSLVACTSF